MMFPSYSYCCGDWKQGDLINMKISVRSQYLCTVLQSFLWKIAHAHPNVSGSMGCCWGGGDLGHWGNNPNDLEDLCCHLRRHLLSSKKSGWDGYIRYVIPSYLLHCHFIMCAFSSNDKGQCVTLCFRACCTLYLSSCSIFMTHIKKCTEYSVILPGKYSVILCWWSVDKFLKHQCEWPRLPAWLMRISY